MFNENRKNIRVEIKNQCTIKTDENTFEGNLFDISVSGVGLESKEKLDINKEIFLKSKINDEEIEITGIVVFSYETNSQYRFGIRFTKVDGKTSYIISNYIREEIIKFLNDINNQNKVFL